MGCKRIGPKCPQCKHDTLLCYGVRLNAKGKTIRYFSCAYCGARMAREYGAMERWAGVVRHGEPPNDKVQDFY